MTPAYRICQFIPTLRRGDAMGGQVIAVHRAAERFGAQCAVFVFEPGNDDAIPYRLSAEYDPRPNDVVVLNYGGRGASEDWVMQLPGRVFLYYHNVTPAHFFARVRAPWAGALRRARDTLFELTHLEALAASYYNRRELMQAGFSDARVIPYILDFEAFTHAAETPAAKSIVERFRRDGCINWLHIGRIVPNKRIEDIVAAFYVYHTRINSRSHLCLVGSDKGFESYSQPMRRWIARLGLQDAVTFAGQIDDRDQVAGFYKLADVYVCMSEHEGFCIPLLEAMIHRVPIIAYRSTGVVDTMGNAGVMVNDKDPRLIAEIVRTVCEDSDCREQLIAGQLTQAQAWHPSQAVQALEEWLRAL